MIKRSGGDLLKLEELREQALEGAFDTRLCKGLEDCLFIPKELIQSIKTAIREFREAGSAENLNIVKKLRREKVF